MSNTHLKLKEKYQKEVVPSLMKQFELPNFFVVPKITKVTVNAGLGRKLLSTEQGKSRDELLSQIKEDFRLITGQTPVETKAKKSIASFKSREGMIIGLKTTLRGQKMYDFLDKVISYVLPRVRDFRGLSVKNLDKSGNLNIGIKDSVIFPEIPPANLKNSFGFQITATVRTKSREQAEKMFRSLGFPLQK